MTAIEFENIGKEYKLGLVSTKTLASDIHRFWVTRMLGREDPYLQVGEENDRTVKSSSGYVWALKDINLKVEQGEVLGIIGRNGSGKSTLLKLLSKVTGPTTGVIRARGRIGALLEVGTGFHPEMTGMENIYLNGAILGMTRRGIQRKLDEIIAFSGCERYIDTPVKRYSSGMLVRLGFAVAAHLDPEILVVDEVLAVGDAEFQKKAIGKMKEVSSEEGRTVLFVSHNMASVRNLCTSGLLLKNGMIEYTGPIGDTISHYLYSDTGSTTALGDSSNRFGTGRLRFDRFALTDADGAEIDGAVSGQHVRMEIGYSLHGDDTDMSGMRLRVHILDEYRNDVVVLSSAESPSSLNNADNICSCTVDIPSLLLRGGRYTVMLYAYYGEDIKDNVCDIVDNAFILRVIPSDVWVPGRVVASGRQAMMNCSFR